MDLPVRPEALLAKACRVAQQSPRSGRRYVAVTSSSSGGCGLKPQVGLIARRADLARALSFQLLAGIRVSEGVPNAARPLWLSTSPSPPPSRSKAATVHSAEAAGQSTSHAARKGSASEDCASHASRSRGATCRPSNRTSLRVADIQRRDLRFDMGAVNRIGRPLAPYQVTHVRRVCGVIGQGCEVAKLPAAELNEHDPGRTRLTHGGEAARRLQVRVGRRLQ